MKDSVIALIEAVVSPVLSFTASAGCRGALRARMDDTNAWSDYCLIPPWAQRSI